MPRHSKVFLSRSCWVQMYEAALFIVFCYTTDLSSGSGWSQILRFKGSELHQDFLRLCFHNDCLANPTPHHVEIFSSFSSAASTVCELQWLISKKKLFFTLLLCFKSISRSTFIWKALNHIHRRLIKGKTYPCCLPSTMVLFFFCFTGNVCFLFAMCRGCEHRKKRNLLKKKTAKTQYEDEGFIRAEGRKKTVDGKENPAVKHNCDVNVRCNSRKKDE